MRNILVLLFSLFLLISVSSCKTYKVVVVKSHPHGMPPGQAKKITGSKSAKPYAPGQVKKKKHKS